MAKTILTGTAMLAALFSKSQQALSEKLSTEAFAEFTAEAQELQNRLSAQEEGNEALKADVATEAAKVVAETAKVTAADANLATVRGELATANTALTTATARVAELSPKAAQWDGYKASLGGTHGADSTTGNAGKKGGVIDAGTQAKIDDMKALAARHPGMMAEFGIPADAE